MTTSGSVTSNEIALRMKAPEREALKQAKGSLTYTQYYLGIKAGIHKRLRLPAAVHKAKRSQWVLVKVYPADEQFNELIADAEKRGISVSKAARADIFLPPKNPAPVTRSEALRLKNTVPTPIRDALEVLRGTDEFSYLKETTESNAFVAIAGILIQREAKVSP